MKIRITGHFSLVLLCALILLASGCLDSASIQDYPDNSSDTPVPGTPPLTIPMVLITPNASNAGVDTRIYPPVHPPTLFIFSLPDAIGILGEPVYIPMKLPPGYTYGGGSANTEGIVSLSISNGSDSIRYLQVSPPHPITGTFTGPFITVIINGTEGQCTAEGDEYQISWSDGMHDFYLIGSLSCDRFMPMAASLGPLTAETLQNVPWKELSPATPLPQSEILNLVFSQEWLMGYDTNPDPQIFNVTMTSEEFNSSFTPDSKDPTLLRQAYVQDDRPVALLNMPKNMFAGFNDDPSKVMINFPDTFFRFYDSMNVLYEDLNLRRAGSPVKEGTTMTPIGTPPFAIPTTPRAF